MGDVGGIDGGTPPADAGTPGGVPGGAPHPVDDGCPACVAARTVVPATKPSKVVAYFRPRDDFDGRFGFDWIRMGDTGLATDVTYKDIVGKYADGVDAGKKLVPAKTPNDASNYARIAKDADKYRDLQTDPYLYDQIDWRTPAGSGPASGCNPLGMFGPPPPSESIATAPILNLYPKAVATATPAKKNVANLRVFYSVEDVPPAKISIVSSDPNVTVTHSTLPTALKGPPDLHKIDFTVECNGELAADAILNIVAEGATPEATKANQSIGRMVVAANAAAHRHKIQAVSILVTTRINKVTATGSVGPSGDFMEKTLLQCLISVNSPAAAPLLDLTPQTVADKAAEKTPIDSFIQGKGTLGEKLLANKGKKMLHDLLDTEFFKTTANKVYKDYFRIYVFGCDGYTDSGTSLNGMAKDIGTDSVVVFDGRADETMVHELMHAMGVYHTFDNDSPYTFQFASTDNIMDYTHHVNKARFTTSKWQWTTMWGKTKPE